MPEPLFAEEGLGHEGGGFAVLVGDVFDDVFVDAHFVAAGEEGGEADVDFRPGRRWRPSWCSRSISMPRSIMVRIISFAQVDLFVIGSNGEVALLVADFVAEGGESSLPVFQMASLESTE